MTRIQLRRLTYARGICVFVWAMLVNVTALAQSQAPVTWQEARWLYLTGWPDVERRMPAYVVPLGDTLLFATRVNNGWADSAWTTPSFDGGETIGAWHLLEHLPNYTTLGFTATGANGRYYIFTRPISPGPSCYVITSPDAGQSWGTPMFPLTGDLQFALATRSFVFRLLTVSNGRYLYRSEDGGQTWPVTQTYSSFQPHTMARGDGLACTATNLLILDQANQFNDSAAYKLFVTVCPNDGEQLLETFQLPYQAEDTVTIASEIAGDTLSDVAGVLSVQSTYEFSQPDQPFFQRSTDGGLTWDFSRSLSNNQWVIPVGDLARPALFCQGQLWMAAWTEEDTPEDGWVSVHARLSANHGKDWYPAQQIADSAFAVNWIRGAFNGDSIQLFWNQRIPVLGNQDFCTVGGGVLRDTIAPILNATLLPSDSVDTLDTIRFEVDVTDNDTVSAVHLLISDQDSSVWSAPMMMDTPGHYAASWAVPQEGSYSFLIFAEDFWENRVALPGTGAFHFVTRGWTQAKEHPEQIQTFAVSVHPNPSNGWPMLTLAPEWMQDRSATITVYNVLGQKFSEVSVTKEVVRLSGEREAGTGLYFARVTNGQRTAVVKFLVAK